MNIHITGRHIDVTAAQRELIESKLGKLERLIDGITDIHVTLSVEKYRQRAEVKVHNRGNTYLTAAEESEDLYSSIQQVIEKVQAQARKHNAKRIGKRRAARHEEAVAEIDGGGAEFLVFRNALNERVNVIYRRRDGNYGLIDPGGQ